MPDQEKSSRGTYRVTASSLNLRSKPIPQAATRVAVLPEGQLVEKVGKAKDPAWWSVTTRIAGEQLSGFVAKRFLAQAEKSDSAPVLPEVPEAHLNKKHPEAKRSEDRARAFPLFEKGQPGRALALPGKSKAAQLAKIIQWLRVDRSRRYRPKAGTTYCNIYACDYCYLAGMYLPRVWWTQSALVALNSGESVTPEYDNSVSELNANSLYEWLTQFGTQFGWQRIFDLDRLQDSVNNGQVGLICARKKDSNRSGHIAVVVPESTRHKAVRTSGEARVVRPLQSQAGRKNFRYDTGTRRWWIDGSFGSFGFWIEGVGKLEEPDS